MVVDNIVDNEKSIGLDADCSSCRAHNASVFLSVTL